jgi:hypothetical protein
MAVMNRGTSHRVISTDTARKNNMDMTMRAFASREKPIKKGVIR